MDKDTRKVVKALHEQGFDTEIAKSGHIKVYLDGQLVSVLPGTGSDWRGLRNGIAQLRRHGFRWPRK